MNDTISRQWLIECVKEGWIKFDTEKDENTFIHLVRDIAPSAQSETIRCKDCKYQDEGWRRVSVKWLPCMDVRTGSNWFCGSAERRED
jgi:hypothetical protein